MYVSLRGSVIVTLTPCSPGQLPDPVKSQGSLRELMAMLKDDRLRQHLLDALQLQTTCENVIKSKVRGKRWYCRMWLL